MKQKQCFTQSGHLSNLKEWRLLTWRRDIFRADTGMVSPEGKCGFRKFERKSILPEAKGPGGGSRKTAQGHLQVGCAPGRWRP